MLCIPCRTVHAITLLTRSRCVMTPSCQQVRANCAATRASSGRTPPVLMCKVELQQLSSKNRAQLPTRCYHNMIKHLTLSYVLLQTESPQADMRRKREVEMIAMGSGTLQSGLACCHVDEAQCCALCEQGTISPRNTVEYGMTSWTGSYEVCVRVTVEFKKTQF